LRRDARADGLQAARQRRHQGGGAAGRSGRAAPDAAAVQRGDEGAGSLGDADLRAHQVGRARPQQAGQPGQLHAEEAAGADRGQGRHPGARPDAGAEAGQQPAPAQGAAAAHAGHERLGAEDRGRLPHRGASRHPGRVPARAGLGAQPLSWDRDAAALASRAALVGAALASAAALAACGDDGDSRAPGPPERAADEAVAAMTGAGEQPAEDEPLLRPMPDGLSEEELVRRTGAVPAWQAALDRGRLLARRGERGAALGRVGAEAGGYRWLIDETDRAGGLGIRIAAAAGAGRDGEALPVEEGMRVMAAGAWEVDEERRWVWRVTRMIRLPDGAGGAGAAPGR